MRDRKSRFGMTAFLGLLAAAAGADLPWVADPAKGRANFKSVEEDGGTEFSVVADPQFGPIFLFDRDAGANRCEAKGAAGYQTREGDLVFIGVRYRITAPPSLTVTGIFQWKTYPTPGHPNDLNFPLLLRPDGGRLVFEAHKPRTDLWSIPTPIDTWFTVVMVIYQHYSQDQGWVELWYNGRKQAFKDGSTRFTCKTLAGGNVEPKWGIYGTNSSAKPASSSRIADLRIARDYPTAAPETWRELATLVPREPARPAAAAAGLGIFDLAGRRLAGPVRGSQGVFTPPARP